MVAVSPEIDRGTHGLPRRSLAFNREAYGVRASPRFRLSSPTMPEIAEKNLSRHLGLQIGDGPVDHDSIVFAGGHFIARTGICKIRCNGRYVMLNLPTAD